MGTIVKKRKKLFHLLSFAVIIALVAGCATDSDAPSNLNDNQLEAPNLDGLPMEPTDPVEQDEPIEPETPAETDESSDFSTDNETLAPEEEGSSDTLDETFEDPDTSNEMNNP